MPRAVSGEADMPRPQGWGRRVRGFRAPRGAHTDAHGYAETREAAMAAFRKELAAGMHPNDVRLRGADSTGQRNTF
jgi:hypothetical protein